MVGFGRGVPLRILNIMVGTFQQYQSWRTAELSVGNVPQSEMPSSSAMCPLIVWKHGKKLAKRKTTQLAFLNKYNS